MGRRKIKITKLTDERKCSLTFYRRKLGILNKAYELSVLCDCDIAIVIFDKHNNLYEYADKNIFEIFTKYSNHKINPKESLTNTDIIRRLHKKHPLSNNNEMEIQPKKYIPEQNNIIPTSRIKLEHNSITNKEPINISRSLVKHEKVINDKHNNNEMELISVSVPSSTLISEQSSYIPRSATSNNVHLSDDEKCTIDNGDDDDFKDIDESILEKLTSSRPIVLRQIQPYIPTNHKNMNKYIPTIISAHNSTINRKKQTIPQINLSNKETKYDVVTNNGNNEHNDLVKTDTRSIVPRLQTMPNLNLVHEENKSQKHQLVQLRYRPYILKNSKKIVSTPVQKSLQVQSILRNGHESRIFIQPIKGVSQTSIQQYRNYSSGFKHVQLKEDLHLTSNSQINSPHPSHSKISDT